MKEKSIVLHVSGMLWQDSAKESKGKQPASSTDHREPHSKASNPSYTGVRPEDLVWEPQPRPCHKGKNLKILSLETPLTVQVLPGTCVWIVSKGDLGSQEMLFQDRLPQVLSSPPSVKRPCDAYFQFLLKTKHSKGAT
jgi:hypothetical protein